jgi:hypothetical protein
MADVFLIAWRRLDEVPEGEAARVWLYATARRVIANRKRSERRRVALRARPYHAWRRYVGERHDRLERRSSVTQEHPVRQGRAGSEMRLVDGTLYGIDDQGDGWVVLGDPASIDPDTGTTPDEYLAAVRQDITGTHSARSLRP